MKVSKGILDENTVAMLLPQCYSTMLSPLITAAHTPDTYISITKSIVYIPFYLLPIKRTDVVLGIEWLHTLRLMMFNFEFPSMTFTMGGNTITLQEESATNL
ncbi:hypothetical protein Lal_00041612 [Lupinus albus]|nr:hypothetical protein Lal_00041612 [Lupinus albus]